VLNCSFKYLPHLLFVCLQPPDQIWIVIAYTVEHIAGKRLILESLGLPHRIDKVIKLVAQLLQKSSSYSCCSCFSSNFKCVDAL
jgi:hypothetical protein